MRKQLLAFLLMFAVLLTSLAIPNQKAKAASTTSSYKEETLLLSGIMEGFTLAKLESTNKVSRQQFAKMLVNASKYQGQVEKSLKTSLYKDVSYKNKYAGYIKIAVSEGWMSATISGKFNPSAKISTKDAAKAMLGLLGYTHSDFSGNLVNAQMSKFNALGLNDHVNKTKNKTLTFANCSNIFYNLLTTKTTQGMIYGSTTLNITMDSDGYVNYLSLLKSNLKGPILLTSSLSSLLPFPTSDATVYRNEVLSDTSSINPYDVIYYSKDLTTIWAYNTKVSGILSSVSPSRTSPTSVTIGTDTYTLGNKDMVYAFSSLGNFSINNVVTLFLGMDDEVVAALNSSDYEIDTYGVVIEYGAYIGSSSDNDTNNRYMTLVTANGSSATYYYNVHDLSISVGNLVHVSYTNGTQTLERITQTYTKLANNSVSASSGKIGSYKVAGDVSIIDTHEGSFKVISLDKINGITLTYSNILYYEFNSAGEISSLILKNALSDDYSYGIITSVNITDSSPTTYSYLINGTTKTLASKLASGTIVAGIGLRIDTYHDASGNISSVSFTKLQSGIVTSITSGNITCAEWTRALASSASIYYKDSSGIFHTTTLSKVSNLNKYTLTAYYDDTTGVSKQVCMIIASDK
ncbi:MAG: S-layer homology domain-containing protein [Velocimicrobium sp.]